MTDNQDGSDILSAAPRRRIPLYVGIPVVVACGLIGYGLSQVLPLHRTPGPAAPAAAVAKPSEPAKGAEAAPVSGPAEPVRATTAIEKPASSTAGTPAAVVLAPPSKLGRGEPPATAPVAKASASAPATAVETGSVEHAPQRVTLPARDKAAARPAEAPEAARAEPASAEQQPVTKRADASPRKRVRRIYRPRVQPKTAKGPFEQLFPALVK